MVKFTWAPGAVANDKAYQTCPVAGTIVRIRIYASASCSAVVDIYKDTWANYPPQGGSPSDSIVNGGTKPTLSSSDHSEDTTLTSYTTSVSAGDVFVGNLDTAPGGVIQLNVEVWIQE